MYAVIRCVRPEMRNETIEADGEKISHSTAIDFCPPCRPTGTQRVTDVMQHTDDLKLVKRVLDKDRAAFDEFFASYFSRLTRFCAARVQASDAVEDIVQEVMVKAVRSLHTYRGEAQLFTWLCQICRNEIATWYRRHGQRETQLMSIDDDPAVRAALESMGVDLQEDLSQRLAIADLVQLTLDYLPDNYGRVLEWKYLEGLSVKEIADRLGVGRLAAQSMLARARKAFRTCFRDLQSELQAQEV